MAIVVLRNFRPSSPSLRWKRRILNLTKKNRNERSVFLASRWTAGRTNLGKKSDRGKKSKLFKKKIAMSNPRFTFTNNFYVKNRYMSSTANKNYWVVESAEGNLTLLPSTYSITAGRMFYDILELQSKNAECGVGVPISIKLIPFFYKIANITLKPYEKYTYACSSGVYSIKLRASKKEKNIKIQLPSGYYRFVPTTTKAILGICSQFWVNKQVVGKAGINSNLGYAPKVRGIAMNSVDHPHGGKANSVQPEKSPWGWVTKASH